MKIYCTHGILDKCLAHEDHIHAYRNVIFAVLFFGSHSSYITLYRCTWFVEITLF